MTRTVIGQPVPRIDGPLKVTGRAQYAAEFNQQNQAYGVIVNSTIGLGRITAIDTAPVLRLPGVIEIFSHLNTPKLAYAPHKGVIDPADGERLHVLQDDRVRFFGQPVALIVADTLENAERAAAVLHVTYAVEPPVTGIHDPRARQVIAPVTTRPGFRVAADRARGMPDAALATSPVQIDVTYEIARENHNPMEPHATIAAWSGNRLTLWSKSQFVSNEKLEMAAIFAIPPDNVRVICPFIGGAFGTSLRTWPHVTLAALAARALSRPVKVALTRKQMFYTTGHRPCTSQHVALGATADGKLTVILHEGFAETSRYETYIESFTGQAEFLYACPNVRTRYRVVPTDTGTPTSMRAPGEATGMHALECAMDELAVALDIDPIELRRRNEPDHDEGAQKPFSSRSLLRCLETGATRFGWERRDRRPGSMRDGRLLIGWGVAASTRSASQAPCDARVRLLADGTAEVEVAAADMGPGTYTSMTQVAADTLGLPMDRVQFRLGMSDYPVAPPHGGSWTMASVGSAVRAACLAALKKRTTAEAGTTVEATASASRPAEMARQFSMYGFGAFFTEVAIDPDIRTIKVRRMVGVYGAGRIVNPRLANSQAIGGMVGGMGMALMEHTAIDPRDGRLVNAHMADYLVPVNLDVDRLEPVFLEEEDMHVNPLGVKGIGELAIVGVAPSIANAVFHATGRRIRELPIRLEHLLA